MGITKNLTLAASMVLAMLLAGGVALAAVEGSAAGQERIVFTVGSFDQSEIYSMNTDGTDRRQLTFNDVADNNPAVSPDGTQVVYEGLGAQGNNPGIWRMNLDGSARRRIGYGNSPAWSPNGRWITYHRYFAQQSDIFKMKSVNGFTKTNLTKTPETSERSPDWSPNGVRIAYSRGRGTNDIYQMRIDGSQQTNLTNTPSEGEHVPEYSPDGRRILFQTTGRDLYKMRADGVGQPTLIYEAPSVDWVSHPWSPDGTQIVFSKPVGEPPRSNHDIFKINADGTGLQNITNSPDSDEESADWYRVPDG